MRNTCCTRLVTLSALLFLCSITSPAEDSFDYVITVGNEQLHFVAQPELGYVVKSSRNNSAVLSLDSTTQRIQSEDVEYLNVANRPDMKIVLSKQSVIRNESNIRILSNQPDTEYIASLFTLDGETVAVIPEIIVRLVHEYDLDKLEELCLELNCTIIRNLLYTNQEFLISPTARNAEEVLETVDFLSSADFIEWAWPNIAFQPKLCGTPVENEPSRVEPTDPYFKMQWHLNKIRTPEAWAYTTGDPNIVVAVLDSGIDIEHPDLIDNIWINPGEIPNNGIDDDGNEKIDDIHGWNFVEDDNDVNPPPDSNDAYYAHGTYCAGLIAAQGNNNIGVTGVTWNCTLMPIRILPAKGTCTTLTEPVEGIRYAAANGADVLSNSWSLYSTDCEPIHSVIQEVTLVGSIGRAGKGCVVLAGSSNYDANRSHQVGYPARYPEVIAVGATDRNDQRWQYSGYASELDLVAPSGDVGSCKGDLWTTDPVGDKWGGCDTNEPNVAEEDRGSFTGTMGGTSGASAVAAGVAALILSTDPNLTNGEVHRILQRSAHDLGPPGWDEQYGFGRVDAYAAVTMALDPLPPLYVDDDSPNDPGPGDPAISDPLEDGSTEHPFDSIQETINYAFEAESVVVLPGTYTGEGNRDIDFLGKAITVRSKDGPDSCIVDCQQLGKGIYFHSLEEADSVLESFTIMNSPRFYYYGIHCYNSSPTIVNCILANNSGRGMMNVGSSPTLINCTFSENSQSYGDAMYNVDSNPTLINCVFSGNFGQGMYNSSSNPILINCVFSANSGKGMNNSSSNPILTNCIFSGNLGGGMYNYGYSNPISNNCTFSGNIAREGGGIYNSQDSNSTIANCILWGNSLPQISGEASISYSDIQGGWEGDGNIDTDPLFVDIDNGDYHLKSEMGRWDPVSQSWVLDDITSPCIDAGDPNSDWAGETWPHGSRINMGTYGGTLQASMSLETEGMTLPRVAYIFSHKNEVAESFQSLLGAYGCPTSLIRLTEMTATPLDSYDLIIVANDTQHEDTWSDPNTVAAIEDSGKPVVGLGDGGYDFFGKLELAIGYPNGAHGSQNSIEVIDPNYSLFRTPYSIEIPEDRALRLYTETDHVGLYLWPTIPETVTALAGDVDSFPYYLLATEYNRYLLWGFTESPEKMTEIGKTLFINVVIWTANKAWESNN